MITVAGVPPASGNAVAAEHPVAHLLEGVVHPLPIRPRIRLLDRLTLGGLGGVEPSLRQRTQHGLQLHPGLSGQPELPGIPTVPRRAQADVPSIGLQRVVGQGAVRVDVVDHPLRQPSRSFGPNWAAYLASICSPQLDRGRVEPDPVDLRQRPLHQVDLLRRDLPVPLRRRQMRPHRRQRLTGHRHPPGQRLRRPDPPARLPDREPQRRRQRPRQAGMAQLTSQVPPLRRPDRLVVGQRQPVPEPLEALQRGRRTGRRRRPPDRRPRPASADAHSPR